MVGIPYFLQALGHVAKKLVPKMPKFDKTEVIGNLIIFMLVSMLIGTIFSVVMSPQCDNDPNTTQTVCTERT